MTTDRIIPVSKPNKAISITKNADGSIAVLHGNGTTSVIPASEKEMQAFVIWTMANQECAE